MTNSGSETDALLSLSLWFNMLVGKQFTVVQCSSFLCSVRHVLFKFTHFGQFTGEFEVAIIGLYKASGSEARENNSKAEKFLILFYLVFQCTRIIFIKRES